MSRIITDGENTFEIPDIGEMDVPEEIISMEKSSNTPKANSKPNDEKVETPTTNSVPTIKEEHKPEPTISFEEENAFRTAILPLAEKLRKNDKPMVEMELAIVARLRAETPERQTQAIATSNLLPVAIMKYLEKDGYKESKNVVSPLSEEDELYLFLKTKVEEYRKLLYSSFAIDDEVGELLKPYYNKGDMGYNFIRKIKHCIPHSKAKYDILDHIRKNQGSINYCD